MSNFNSIRQPSQNWLKEVGEFISHITGVQLGEKQASMLESRLKKRISDLGLSGPEEYLDYLKGHVDVESTHLVSLLTTHHTFFFREFSHFQYLEKTALPEIIQTLRASGRKTVRVWSAACSQGQEPYSLAMFLFHHLKTLSPETTFEILGTDVDPDSIAKARNGVYRWNDVKEIPLIYLWNHWARGSGDIKDFVKAKQTIRKPCRFEVANLMNIPDPKAGEAYDIIFCRNVFIYFTPEQIKKIVHQFLKYLSPNGSFIIGTSESLLGMDLPIKTVAPSVYCHKNANTKGTAKNPSAAKPALSVVGGTTARGASTPTTSSTTSPSTVSIPTVEQKVRVLCVDDSMPVLTLLKKVFSEGFEVVATAKNGIEAKELLAKHSVDVMTLDIHMPQQGGLEYLKANFGPKHPPVVMISSVPREDSTLAFECLTLGASDYIEKPSLSDIAARSEEIRTKVRIAAVSGRAGEVRAAGIDRSFQQNFEIKNPDEKLRCMFVGLRDRMKLAAFCTELVSNQPPTIVFIEGASGILPSIKSLIHDQSKKNVEILDSLSNDLNPGHIYLADPARLHSEIHVRYGKRLVSVVVIGDVSKEGLARVKQWDKAHRIVEEIEGSNSKSYDGLINNAQYVVPYTSMAYHSNEYFAKNEGKK